MEYICKPCDYAADNKFNYDRHLKTKKHIEKVNKLNMSSHRNQIVIEKSSSEIVIHPIIDKNDIFMCVYCNTIFNKKQNLSRHRKTCLEKRELNNSIKKLQDKLSYEIALREEITKNKDEVTKNKDETILILNHENKNLKFLLNSAGALVEKSMSNLNYINKHYTNAPALKLIKDATSLHEGLEEDCVVDNIIREFRSNKLTVFIGGIIVGTYKKEDPKLQAIWNSDADRLTYMIRTILINDSLQWEVDKKGINTTKNIIKPILDYINEQLENYIRECKLHKRSEKSEKILIMHDKLLDAHNIINLISNGTLVDSILKYIAPYLYIVKETNELV